LTNFTNPYGGPARHWYDREVADGADEAGHAGMLSRGFDTEPSADENDFNGCYSFQPEV
jgi:hypothetical protein